MNDQYRQFGARVKKIDRRHRKMSDGYAATMNSDGLLIAVPRRRRLRVPFAGIALLAVGIIAFKGVVLAQAGGAEYEARIDGLAQGTQVEKAAAWVMQADPLTRWVAQQASLLAR